MNKDDLVYSCPVGYEKVKDFLDAFNKVGPGKKFKDYWREDKELSGYVVERLKTFINNLAQCTPKEILYIRKNKVFIRDGHLIKMRGEKLEIYKRRN